MKDENRRKLLEIFNDEMYLAKNEEERKTAFIPIAEPQLGFEEFANLSDAYLSTWISSLGDYITSFENAFSTYCGRMYGVSTSNGTTALHLALAALEIGKGDEVIVPDITFAATINAVLYVGATPVIVDIEKDSWCINPTEIENAITEKTKAIIPVHIYGQPCDMERIMDIAKRHNIYVVEDCAEAHGAEFDGRKVGSFGNIACFSFFGNKVITSGEGGMCLTDSEELNSRMRVLRDHGMNKQFKYYHDRVGFNYRMTNMQAAIGLAQLQDINSKLIWRNELEMKYREAFKEIGEVHFQNSSIDKRTKVTWLVTAYVDSEIQRNRIMEQMKTDRIDARPFFVPLSHMKIYSDYCSSNKVSTDISKRGFNLPTSSFIGDIEINRIILSVKKALEK